MSKSSLKKDEAQIPDVQPGDEIYFRHGEGPKPGRVVASGKHGCMVDCEGSRHKVRWDAMLGHRVRIQQNYSVVDNGEDGCIVQDGDGRRRYVHDPDTTAKAGEGPIRKSHLPVVLMFGNSRDMMKAIKNGPGLSLQPVTDKGGRQTKRWKRTAKDEPKERPGGGDEAGAKHGYGTHNLGAGDKVKFKVGDTEFDGEIDGDPGKDGAHVIDSHGHKHQVRWDEISGHEPGKKTDAKPAAAEHKVAAEQKPIPAESFKASDYAKSHDDAGVTPEAILSGFPPDTAGKIADVQERLKSIELTINRYKQGNGYNADRQSVHRKVYAEMMSAEAVKAATPEPGKSPTFTMLGGRGGSGKGWFTERDDGTTPMVDPSKAIVLDADRIKKLLPEYEGWNAEQVHEESSDILEDIERIARSMGLNVVLDATMKTAKGALTRVQDFKKSGYRVEAHYMHLPRQEAAKRAVDRFLGKTQRYVPISVVLGNTTNEDSFDQVRQHADAWSFRDNNVPKGQEPILISHSGSEDTGKGEPDAGKKDDLKKPESGSKSAS